MRSLQRPSAPKSVQSFLLKRIIEEDEQMSQVMTFQEMEQKYEDQWLLIAYTKSSYLRGYSSNRGKSYCRGNS